MSDKTHPFWKALAGELAMPPAAELLGWKALEAEPGSGRIRVQYDAGPNFTNPLGNVQGGFLAAMLDEVLGPALVTTLDADQFGVTIEIKVNFIRPAKPGRFIGEGSVVHKGGSIAFMEGSLTDPDGSVVATASATARILRIGADDIKL